MSIELYSDEPLRYVDRDTRKQVEVRKIIDPDNGREIFIAFDGDRIEVVRVHVASMKNKTWKRTLAVDEESENPFLLGKACDVAEKQRIQNLTTQVSAAEII